jgi:hypothetical protein
MGVKLSKNKLKNIIRRQNSKIYSLEKDLKNLEFKIEKYNKKRFLIFSPKPIPVELKTSEIVTKKRINELKSQKNLLRVFTSLAYSNKGNNIEIYSEVYENFYKTKKREFLKELEHGKNEIIEEGLKWEIEISKERYDLAKSLLIILKEINKSVHDKPINDKNQISNLSGKFNDYLLAFKKKKVHVNKIKKVDDNIVFETLNKLDITMPLKIKNLNSKILKSFFIEEDLSLLFNFFNKGFRDSRLERIKKKNVSMGVNSNFFIKEIALTTEGLYAKLISGSKEQPIMISWTGKVLKKKQGVVFWKLEE